MASHKSLPKTEPEMVEMPSQTMAVVRTEGDPNVVAADAVRALYASVYALKFALKSKQRDFKVVGLRALAQRAPRAEGPMDRHLGATDPR